jgi:hypothetical protein
MCIVTTPTGPLKMLLHSKQQIMEAISVFVTRVRRGRIWRRYSPNHKFFLKEDFAFSSVSQTKSII